MSYTCQLKSAIESSDNRIVSELIEQMDVDEINKEENGGMALHAACMSKNNKAVELLLAGIDVNVRNSSGWTSLHLACRSNNLVAVEKLLASPHIDVNAKAGWGWTSLRTTNEFSIVRTACNNNHHRIVKKLLASPVIDVNADDDDGDTAIMCAAKYCDEKVLKLLLDDTRVSLDTKNKDGRGLVVVIGIWGRGKNCSKEEKGKCLDMIKNERMKREQEREQTSQTKSIGQCIERIEKINERIEDEEKRHKENLHGRKLKRKDLNERQIFDTKILAEKHKEEKSLLDKKHKHEETMLEETLVREDDYEQRYIASLKERRDELAEDLEKLTTEPGNESSPERNKLEAAKGSLECPICMELMRPPTKIWMCPLTHVLCEDCKVYLKGGKCPTCTTERVSLRAFMAENLARTLFSD